MLRTTSRSVGGGVAAMLLAKREKRMFTTIATAIRRRALTTLRTIYCRLLAFTRPATGACVGSAVSDLARTKAALVAENAFLR